MGLHEPLERSTPLPPVPNNRIEMPAKAEGADELDDDVIHSNTHTGKETRVDMADRRGGSWTVGGTAGCWVESNGQWFSIHAFRLEGGLSTGLDHVIAMPPPYPNRPKGCVCVFVQPFFAFHFAWNVWNVNFSTKPSSSGRGWAFSSAARKSGRRFPVKCGMTELEL